ncbi:hypothetical protein BGW38_010829 [Lunasporangiospora selenospora]|uniref:F-box domain-containing protein n=1 Tax=Lunasporangiospora selenospora TaxID=979761 RepID=A0A9P6FVQ5_9FUNG|nr:hypothetical protein BGW38_010829 [Lunasporangiospora selenospora]
MVLCEEDQSRSSFAHTTPSLRPFSSEALSPIQAKDAIHIPEITAIIARNLKKTDISACSRVSKAWLQTFLPLLWESIDTRLGSSHRSDLSVPGLMAKYGQWVKTLTVIEASGWEISRKAKEYQRTFNTTTTLSSLPLSRIALDSMLVFDCSSLRNITRLSIHVGVNRIQGYRNLIHRNQETLRFLFLAITETSIFRQMPIQSPIRGKSRLKEDDESRFYMLLFDFPQRAYSLHTLYLEHWKITREELGWTLEGCPNLKSLSLEDILILDIDEDLTDSESSADSFDTILKATSSGRHVPAPLEPLQFNGGQAPLPVFQHKSLETFRMCSKIYNIIDHFPNLKSIEFYRFDRPIQEQTLNQFCNSLVRSCPKVQEIHANGFECSMLPAVLSSIQRLVIFRGSSDLPTVTKILTSDLRESLEEATLSDYCKQTHLPLHFLERCPRLQVYQTGLTETTLGEVIDSIHRPGGGWVCHDLRELRLSIMGLSPAMIEAIMSDLKAKRVVEPKAAHRGLISYGFASDSESGGNGQSGVHVREKDGPLSNSDLLAMALRESLMTPVQKTFHRDFSAFLRTFKALRRLNLGTGWYKIPRSK